MKPRRDYKAAEIAVMTDDQLRVLPEGGLRITFDDGSVSKCKTFKTVYVAPLWAFIKNNGGEILQGASMCRTIDGNYEEDLYTSSIQLQISAYIFWHTFYSGKECHVRFNEMSRQLYEATNRMYNYHVLNDMSYVSTAWHYDLIQVIMHPGIRELKDQWIKGKINTKECHDKSYNIVHDDIEYFKDNDIHKAVRCDMLSKTQLKQMIGPRDVVPDINSEAAPHPIEPGYTEGLTKAVDSVAEAKTASIALYMQGGPLEDSEYNNRLCQLMCSYIRKVEYRDCGTKLGLETLIPDKETLKFLKGKYLLNEDGTSYRVRGNEEQLIGKIVYVRSAATCKEKEQGVVCHKCLGEAAYLVPENASPGHVLIIDPLGQISQTILSTKHVLANVIALTLKIPTDAAKYVRLHDENKYVVMFNGYKPKKDTDNVILRIPHNQAEFISDIDQVEDPAKLNITAVSDIHDLVIGEGEDGSRSYIHLDTSVSGVGSCLTTEALRYIKEYGWDIVGSDIEIDMSNWDHDEPLLVTKRVSQDVTETLNRFKEFIAPTKDPKKRKNTISKNILTCESVQEAIDELWNILKSKISVSYVQLEMFVVSLMSRTDNYMFPDAGEPFRFLTQKEALSKRSALVSLGYQFQFKYLIDPDTYLKDPDEVPPHPMDGLIARGYGFHNE